LIKLSAWERMVLASAKLPLLMAFSAFLISSFWANATAPTSKAIAMTCFFIVRILWMFIIFCKIKK
jgi:hypothetical protein